MKIILKIILYRIFKYNFNNYNEYKKDVLLIKMVGIRIDAHVTTQEFKFRSVVVCLQLFEQ